MIFKRLASFAFMLLVLSFPAFATMVSFLVVETGIGEEIASSQYSSLWEGALMDVFFDAGHIVTNHPVARMQEKPGLELPDIIKIDFYEALEGGAEYFLLGYLEYKNSEEIAVPVQITLKLYKLESRELIYERIFPAGNGNNLNEDYQLAQRAGQTIISRIKD